MKAYPKYKPSGVEWIGEIPEKWELTRMKYVAPLQGGYAFKTEAFKTEGIAIVKMNNLKRGRLDLSDAVRVDFKAAVDAFSLKAGDLLFGMSGSLGETGSLGNFAVVNLVDIPCQLNQRVGRFVALQNCSLDFVRFLITSVSFTEPIMSSSTGTAQFNISSEQIGNILISLPPLPEQRAIADFLDRKTTQIDGFIAKKQKLIELLREERVAVINNQLTKCNGKIKKLKYLVIKVGSGITPSGGASTYLFDGIPLLRSQNIHFDGLKLDDVAYISKEVHDSMSNSKVNSGDVLLNITGGSIGRCFYVSSNLGEANVNQHVCILRPNKLIGTKFLYILLSSELGQRQIDFHQTGANREGLNFEQLRNFAFNIPSLDEQNELVSKLESEITKIDRTIATIEKEIELIQEYRTALISEAVTGKIDVRD